MASTPGTVREAAEEQKLYDWSSGVPVGVRREAGTALVRIRRVALPRGAVRRHVRLARRVDEVLELREGERVQRLFELDPAVPWAAGARPCGRAAGAGLERVMHTSLGLAFVDGGTTQSFVLGEVADAYPGGKMVELDVPVAVYGASAPVEEEAAIESALFVAKRKLVVEITLQWSVDEAERGSRYGIKPRVQEFGTTLELLVCEDHRVLRDFVPGLEGLRVVIGEDIEKTKGWQRVYADFLKAQHGETPMWTHAQRSSLQGVVRGAERSYAQDFSPAAVTYDVREGELPYPQRSPFELDEELDWERKHSASDRGDSKIPRDREGMMAFLGEKLRRKGRVVEKYLPELADILVKHREVLLDPRPSRNAILRPRVLPGSKPTRVGLTRRVPREAIVGLNEEVGKLREHGMVVSVAAKADGGPPDDLWVNGLVVTVRRAAPGTPAGTPPRVRMCVDPAANKFSAEKSTTVLPVLGEHVGSSDGQCLFTGLDCPNGYHQCMVDETGQLLFGFCLEDVEGVMRYYKYVGAPFGFHSFPALFQEHMLRVVSGAQGVPLSTVRVFLDDVLLGTKGRNGKRLDEVWGSAEEGVLVRSHLECLDKVLEGYVRYGMVINLGKSDLLQESIGVCGIWTDGVSRRIDPARTDGWDNMGKPAKVTLAWLQHILGLANYCSGFLPHEYMRRSEPLFELARVAGRAMSEAGDSKGEKKKAMGLPDAMWGEVHDEALEWIVKSIKDSQTRYFLDFTKKVHVLSDASEVGVAALIGQYDEEGVFRICYTLCKRFTQQQELWSVGAREVYGWLVACRKWWKLLAFADVVFSSDHHNLVTSAADMENVHLKRWCMELAQWDAFTRHRVHRRGEQNIVCDVLSRCAAGQNLDAEDGAQVVSPILRNLVRVSGRRAAAQARQRVERVVEEAPELVVFDNPHVDALSPFVMNVLEAQSRLDEKKVEEYLANRTWRVERKEWRERQVLWAKGKLLVPEEPHLLAGVFEVVHDRNLHVGENLVREALARAHLFIPNFATHWEDYYSACSCQHARAPKHELKQGELLVGPRYFPLAHIFMDFAHLPVTEQGQDTYVGAVVVVDACSRVCQFMAVKDMTAGTAVRCLERWMGTWGPPCMVHSDNGSHFTGGEFTDFLCRNGIQADLGTPRHPRGRGLPERLVGKLKSGLVRLLPQGRLLDWPSVLLELEQRVNRMPHRGLAGESPFDYLIRGHRQRLDFLAPLNGLDGWMGTEQEEEDLLMALQALRQVADWCGEISAVQRTIVTAKALAAPKFKVGDWVLKFVAERANSLEPLYQGPFCVTADLRNGFYTVNEVLAGDALGNAVDAHVSRLLAFDKRRTSADAEHARKLPQGYYVVEDILEGPNAEGLFLVKWMGVSEPKWAEPQELRAVRKFQAYCEQRRLDKSGKPLPPPRAMGRNRAVGGAAQQ